MKQIISSLCMLHLLPLKLKRELLKLLRNHVVLRENEGVVSQGKSLPGSKTVLQSSDSAPAEDTSAIQTNPEKSEVLAT